MASQKSDGLIIHSPFSKHKTGIDDVLVGNKTTERHRTSKLNEQCPEYDRDKLRVRTELE